jgi:cysteine-rich repeat protein
MDKQFNRRFGYALLLLLSTVLLGTVRPEAVAQQTESPVSPPVVVGSALADSIINLKQWKVADGGNDHWYGILAVLHNWHDADSIAKILLVDTMTGYLATIKNSAENAFIFDSVLAGVDPPSLGKLFFLGGRATSDVWTWAWSTGEPFCYTRWVAGEPNYSWETALAIWGPTAGPLEDYRGYWNNVSADDTDFAYAPYWAVVEWGPPDFSTLSICNNGIVECGEECDDRNDLDNDGCNSACILEVCGDGIQQPWEDCDDGNTIAGDGCDPPCYTVACGNGRLETGECCDDGNTLDGDGCSAGCLDETTVCGDGVLDCGEECDDGNNTANDGCNSVCVREVCGDGILQPWEECDDGNTIAGDGCDPVCRTEECGNNRVDFGECCDDGNTQDGDGCSAGCLDETTVCGDGVLDCGEECDDGNTASGDGCSPSCEIVCVPGDLNSSETVTSTDIICMVNYVFLRLRGICDMEPCPFVADVNCNGVVTSADIIYLVNHIFKSGVPPCNSCAECGL